MIMHTGIISFCDRVRYNIKSSETKDAILLDMERKYHIRILQRHWFKLDDTTAPQLKKSPHWACLRSNGNPYYMFFTRFDDVNIIYFIDKKVQPGYEKPRIILGRGMFDDDLFNDTILDGEMVRRTDEPGWVFLVNDVIAYCGKFLQHMLLPERIGYAYELFHSKYVADPLLDVCLFRIKKYVETSKDAVNNLIEFSNTLPYTSRGIYFWCHHNKLKPKLYNFDDGLIKSVYRKVKDTTEFRENTIPVTENEENTENKIEEKTVTTIQEPVKTPIIKEVKKITTRKDNKQAPKIIENVQMNFDDKILWLRKTENPDIFDIFTTQQCVEKLGNAYIASLTTSKKLRNVFKDLTVAVGVPFLCSYNKQFEKWTPIKQIE